MVRAARSTERLLTAIVPFLFAALFCLPTRAEAHHTGDHAVTLHVNNTWPQCAMVLDPSLTQTEFHDFVRELTPILYSRPLAGAKPLDKFNFEFSIEMWRTSAIQDWTGKWNNTFSHPMADHWLTGDDHTLGFMVPRMRMGVTDRIDAEIFYTAAPGSNYSFLGLAMKYAFINDAETGWAFAARPSYTTLLGVDDLKANTIAVDLLASKDIGLFRPYAGLTLLHGSASETTTKVDLRSEISDAVDWMAGSEFNWKHLSMALEAAFGALNIYSFKVGVTF